MFKLKVNWKKRIVVGLLSIIPMIALVTFFIILCIQKQKYDGLTVAIVCSVVFCIGIPELIFFEKDKSRRLDYIALKEEEYWKPTPLGLLIRTSMFLIILVYLIIVIVSKK